MLFNTSWFKSNGNNVCASIISISIPTWVNSLAVSSTNLSVDPYETTVTSLPSLIVSTIPIGVVKSPILLGNFSFNLYPLRFSTIKAGSSLCKRVL